MQEHTTLSSRIELRLPTQPSVESAASAQAQRRMFAAKTAAYKGANSVAAGQRRGGTESRVGHHHHDPRWSQATMVVVARGGDERQRQRVISTELLTVTTRRGVTSQEPGDGDNHRKLNEKALVLPDIQVTNSVAKEHDVNGVVASKEDSPAKFLPAFDALQSTKDAGSTSDKVKAAVATRIKFWRGTTPLDRHTEFVVTTPSKKWKGGKAGKNAKAAANSDDNAGPAESKGFGGSTQQQPWSEQVVATLEDKNLKRYLNWHMALRERMLSHEKMHYHEAVTRINKYRQRLKQRAVLPPSKSDNNIINDIQAWKEILERNKTKAPANEAPGARMSPTKEWKPLIVTDNDDEKGQKVPPFFGKTPSELPKKPTPHHSNARGNKIASAAAKRAGAHASQSESVKGNYPVHGEALLKTANAEKAASTSNDETSLPNIASPSRTGFHMTDPTKLPGSGPKNARRSNKAENRQQDDAEKTRTLINSLKQLKVTSGGENSMVTAGTDRSSTAPPSKPPPPTRDHASKLRLLMQSSSQAQRDAEEAGGGRSRRSAGATKITGSRMGSRRAVNRRPITQPHALGGDGTLPKIHNIISSALLKSGKLLDAVDRPQVKHRLTLNGVAKRDAFATNVLGIAKKHQRAAAADARVVDDDVIPSPTTDAALSLAVTNDKHDQTTQQMPNNNVKNSAKQQPADSKPGKSWKKNGGLAQRIYNPLYVQHKSMASKPNMHVNPQHSSLQLVSSTASMDDAAAGQTSQPTSPSRASRADGYSPTTADRRSTTRTRGRKRAAKQKVMRVSVVEPPQTALERQRRQMEIEMSSRRLAMNPAHAAVSNFTTAVLNSELALRAPSSSPVDMYMRELYINNLDGAGEDWAEMQRHERRSAEQFHQSMAQFQPHPQHSDYRMMINNTDGLNLPIPNVISSRHDISRLFSRHHKQPTVEEATPKIKDYVGLQRLYNAMKKHGDHRPGAVYHYSAASPASLMKASSAPLEMHALTRTHHTRRSQRGASEPPIKTPYYYNPYKGYSDPIQVNPAPFAEDAVYGAGGGPLYAVVTGAAEFPAPTAVATPNSMGQQRRHHHAYPGKYEAVGVAPAPVGGAGKHEITIMMPDTSAVLVQHTPHLEKIKEHVTN